MKGPFCAIALGALVLLWPALVNGYPILYSDTQAFLIQGGRPFMIWDKPFIYGPFLRLDAGVTLWAPIVVQAGMLSFLLWKAAALVKTATPLRHVLICMALAATAAPWFASTAMPDIFAPITVLCLAVLAFTGWQWSIGLIAILAIASHLSHLVIAAGCIAMAVCLHAKYWKATSVPLIAALAILLATNIVGFGKFGISPFGSIFALGRLVGDGPARDTIERDCPASKWWLCTWKDRLPADSETFMWSPTGPVWTAPGGPIGLAQEASAIVRQTLIAEPIAVTKSALKNALTQSTMIRLDDLVVNGAWVNVARRALAEFLPQSASRSFDNSRQVQGTLGLIAMPINAIAAPLTAIFALVSVGIALFARRRPALRKLAAMIVVGVAVNAFATGALSAPVDRYQARIAWLVFLPALFQIGARTSTSAGDMRTSFS
jgi:hypothetical protein